MQERIKGVLSLDTDTFREIEHDPQATNQAAIVVLIVAILSALGVGLGGGNVVTGFLGTLVWAFVGWFLWSAVTYFIGTKFFSAEATLQEMLRVIGWAQLPRVFAVLGFIPCIGLAITLLVWAWSLVAAVIAIREGLDLEWGPTLVTVVAGWLVILIGQGILWFIAGGLSSLLP